MSQSIQSMQLDIQNKEKRIIALEEYVELERILALKTGFILSDDSSDDHDSLDGPPSEWNDNDKSSMGDLDESDEDPYQGQLRDQMGNNVIG
eukprot:CAMPEP_0201588598 /NCGR_PEP_ID=MMETSP0190_2-20130828/156931_1 /ASSEMBLY_ACC=CAM_ASM_000263 /TAXON_ID=37353 /ORGANISM="Rosalina sp." /LENGTH=91 /DNA_ID=CAMNT_0048041085 /DNA_START=83 /DNA_END=358 /DNA_ORIENTATION=-